MDLRRKVCYKPRRGRAEPRPTAHGPERSRATFLSPPGEERAAACEMDCAIGRVRDVQCSLTLYHRSSRVQLAFLLPERTRGPSRAPSTRSSALWAGRRSRGSSAWSWRTTGPSSPTSGRLRSRSSLEPSLGAACSTVAYANPSRRRAASATTRSCESSCPRARDQLRRPGRAGLRGADEPAQLDAQAVARGAEPPRDARGRHAGGGGRAHGCARDPRGPLRGTRPGPARPGPDAS